MARTAVTALQQHIEEVRREPLPLDIEQHASDPGTRIAAGTRSEAVHPPAWHRWASRIIDRTDYRKGAESPTPAQGERSCYKASQGARPPDATRGNAQIIEQLL